MAVSKLWICLLVLGLCAKATGDRTDPLLNLKRDIVPKDHDCFEEKLVYIPQIGDLEEQIIAQRETKNDPQLNRETRGSAEKVKKFTVYDEEGTAIKGTILSLSKKGHNYLRRKHRDTEPLKYRSEIADTAQAYAEKLAKSGKFEHDPKIRGIYGENLYRQSNTYDLIANLAHANYAWYEESWKPLEPAKKKNYDYSFNPKSTTDFMKAGVGHFTQMIWKATTSLGCGVATSTYKQGGRPWRRTVVACRYEVPGNFLGRFPDNVKPLISGTKTLEKSLGREKLYSGKASCISAMPLSTCELWKKYGWCNRDWAIADCNCTCRNKKG